MTTAHSYGPRGMADQATGLTGNEPDELSGISDKVVRHGFVKKVYSILFVQLTVTTLIAGLITRSGDDMAKSDPNTVTMLLFFSMAVVVSMGFVFCCCPDTMRRSPLNYALLSVFTVAEAVMVGFTCLQYTQESVLVTLGITAAVVLSLTLFTFQTKYDFSGLAPYMFVLVTVMCGLGFVLMIGSMLGLHGEAWKAMNLVYAALGALVFSAYLVVDTQMIVGGKHTRFRFTVDDYCMAAINLYLDIVQLFIFLLRLFGERRR